MKTELNKKVVDCAVFAALGVAAIIQVPKTIKDLKEKIDNREFPSQPQKTAD